MAPNRDLGIKEQHGGKGNSRGNPPNSTNPPGAGKEKKVRKAPTTVKQYTQQWIAHCTSWVRG